MASVVEMAACCELHNNQENVTSYAVIDMSGAARLQMRSMVNLRQSGRMVMSCFKLLHVAKQKARATRHRQSATHV